MVVLPASGAVASEMKSRERQKAAEALDVLALVSPRGDSASLPGDAGVGERVGKIPENEVQ